MEKSLSARGDQGRFWEMCNIYEVAPLVSLIPFLLTPYSSTALQCFLIVPGAFGGFHTLLT